MSLQVDDPVIVSATMPFRQLVRQWCDIDEGLASWRRLVNGAVGAAEV
jgi:hypothetical protein